MSGAFNPIAFGRHPDWRRVAGPSPAFYAKGIGFLFLVGFGGAFVLGLIQQAAVSVLSAENELDSLLDDLSSLEQLLLVVGFAPIAEEVAYRLALLPSLRWPIVGLTLIVIGFLFLWPVLLLAVVFMFAAAAQPLREGMQRTWTERPAIPIWISILLFGFAHIVNFGIDWNLTALVLTPVLVGPQIWLGLVFTVSRVRLGFPAAIIQHAVHNAFVWMLFYWADSVDASGTLIPI